MADAFEPRFVDLVRNFTSTMGEADFVLGAAVSGFTSFTAALTAGDRFYYCAVSVDRPAEREVGRGTLQADGTIKREPIEGALTSFGNGTKTVALVVAADWFATTHGAASGSAGSSFLFTDIPNRRFPSHVTRIFTSGRTRVGEYPAAYIRDPDQSQYTLAGQAMIDFNASDEAAAAAAVAAIIERIRVRDAAGAYWIIDDDGQEVHAGHFGAVADGGYSQANGAASMTGTDNAAAFQALIDWRIYFQYGTPAAHRDLVIPPGLFRTSRPMRIGYGDVSAIQRSYRLRGGGCGFLRDGGTQILADFDNHPVVALNSARFSIVEDLGFVGRSGAWIAHRQLASSSHGSFALGIDDRQLSSWFDPSKPNLDPARRYSPHCAVAIDPYCGPAPAGAYPPLPEPPFIRDFEKTLYNGNVNGSTHVTIRRCRFDGFPVAVALQPSDFDANGDWLAIEDSSIAACAVALSAGNVNSRNLHMRRCLISSTHTVAATDLHGKQSGQLGGMFVDCGSIFNIQLLKLGPTGRVRDTVLQNWRAEHLHRIADVSSAAGEDGGCIRFNASSFLFKHLAGNNQRGRPLNVVGDRAGGNGPDVGDLFYFDDDCFFAEFGDVLPMMTQGIRVGGRVKPSNVFANLPSQAYARMQNVLAGGLVTPRFRRDSLGIIRFKGRHESALGTGADRSTSPRNAQFSRDYTAPHYLESLMPANGISQEAILTPNARTVAKSHGYAGAGGAVLTDRTLTFTSTMTVSMTRQRGLMPGCVLLDDPSGLVFLVTGRSGSSGAYTYTCELQNGFRYDGSGAVLLEVPFNPAVGSFYWVGGGFFTPDSPLFADVTAGSTDLTNVHRGDTAIPFTSAGPVGVGDLLWRDDFTEGHLLTEGLTVSSIVTGGYGTFKYVMSAAVSSASAARRRLPLWVRLS